MTKDLTNKQVLVLPKSTKLSARDHKALRDAGIVVIHVDSPSEVRMLTADPIPVPASALARAAVVGLNGAGSDIAKKAAWDALTRILLEQQK